MKAQELRIGNWVTDKWYADLPKVITIESIGDKGINVSIDHEGSGWIQTPVFEYEHLFDELHGIPLTEERLLRFGFEKNGFWYQIPTESDLIFTVAMFQGKWVCGHVQGIGTKYFHPYTLFDDRLEFVHQLQNICFDLGEGLTLKDL